jgi:hypothetical protein
VGGDGKRRNRLFSASLGVIVLAVAGLGASAEEPAKAWIYCVSEPAGAKVLMGHPMSADNWDKGTAPTKIAIFEAGPEPRQVRITFVKPGYEPYTTTVAVREGDELRVVGNLLPRRMMGYVSDAKLVIANADGSVPTDVAVLEQPVSPEAPAWFPDSRSLCVWQGGTLTRMSPDGEKLGVVAEPAAVGAVLGLKQTLELSGAAVLASGRWVAVCARWGGHSDAAVLVPADGKSPPEVLLPDTYALRASPTEDALIALTRDGAELLRIRETGEADLVRRVAGATDAAWSDDGKRIALALRGEVYVGDALLGEVTQLTSSEAAGPTDLLWSPEGSQLVCTIHREAARKEAWDELWLLAAPGEAGEPTLLLDGRTHPNSADLSPLAFIPYSTRLAYRSGTRTYAIDLADPSSDSVLLFNSSFPAWSRATTEDIGPLPGEDRAPLVQPGLTLEEPGLAGAGGAR